MFIYCDDDGDFINCVFVLFIHILYLYMLSNFAIEKLRIISVFVCVCNGTVGDHTNVETRKLI